MNITINGSAIVAQEGITILEAARRAEIHIPTLCSVKAGHGETACGLCVVEVAGEPQLLRACATELVNGMEINTDSEAISSHRKERLTLLMADHFGDCKAPCNLTCPGQINVQGYIAHVAKGQYEEALRLVMERNPLPFSVGRVCPRFCETRCRRILVDDPVSINHLKRFVADWCMANKVDLRLGKGDATGKSIAVIGGGPAGLTAAYFLARKGHEVTIFEAAPKLGGMLRYGLPEYKIPRDVLDYEINTILRLGINVRLNQKWGLDFTLQDLQDQNFDSTLLTVGCQVDEPLDIPGATLGGVMPASLFLKEMAMGKGGEYGRRAAVIGGNNIAMDTARSLIRAGVDEVTVIYFRSRDEMPANQRNIREAEQDGVQFLLMASPVQISQTGEALAMELIRMRLGKPDKRGKRQPEPAPGSSNTLEVETIISASSLMASDGPFTGGELERSLELTPKNNIKANPRSFLTNLTDVYAAGDATSGPRSVIQAVVAARRAVENIHAQIMGVAKTPADSRFNFSRGKAFDDVDLRNFDGIQVKLREKLPERPPEIASQDFDEVKLGFNEKMAKTEAERCLSCGCTAFDRCTLKELALEHGLDPNKTAQATVPTYPVDDRHAVIRVDLNKCIFCQNCVQACEYDGLDLRAASVNGQGQASNLSLAFNENCISCGQCVDNCSTGALNKKDQNVPMVHEPIRDVRTTCPYCGAGCQMVLRVKGDTIMEVTSDPELAPNYGALCVKGRFGFNFVQSPERLTMPLVRRNGHLVETSWEDALDTVAKRFFDIKAMYGPDAIAGFSCARATNEENFLMQKFMRTAIGTNNIDHCARL